MQILAQRHSVGSVVYHLWMMGGRNVIYNTIEKVGLCCPAPPLTWLGSWGFPRGAAAVERLFTGTPSPPQGTRWPCCTRPVAVSTCQVLRGTGSVAQCLSSGRMPSRRCWKESRYLLVKPPALSQHSRSRRVWEAPRDSGRVAEG